MKRGSYPVSSTLVLCFQIWAVRNLGSFEKTISRTHRLDQRFSEPRTIRSSFGMHCSMIDINMVCHCVQYWSTHSQTSASQSVSEINLKGFAKST